MIINHIVDMTKNSFDEIIERKIKKSIRLEMNHNELSCRRVKVQISTPNARETDENVITKM